MKGRSDLQKSKVKEGKRDEPEIQEQDKASESKQAITTGKIGNNGGLVGVLKYGS